MKYYEKRTNIYVNLVILSKKKSLKLGRKGRFAKKFLTFLKSWNFFIIIYSMRYALKIVKAFVIISRE